MSLWALPSRMVGAWFLCVHLLIKVYILKKAAFEVRLVHNKSKDSCAFEQFIMHKKAELAATICKVSRPYIIRYRTYPQDVIAIYSTRY